jgi:site-specific DNA-methyltransferase (adenine-specific)
MSYLNVVGCADANVWLAQLPENSVDSVVCDPPYGLGEPPPPLEVLAAWLRGRDFDPKAGSKGFMGKEWDAFVPQPSLWKNVLRVLKPGGYLLAFFGSRTFDWGSLAIRVAGLDVVDSLQWLYGKGFPKGLDISKAIDAQLTGGRSDSVGLKKTNEEVRKGAGRVRKKSQNNGIVTGAQTTEVGPRVIRDEPATPEGALWKGWNTTLKPAFEPIVMARKPFNGTYAQNVLEHGVGALNIDGCRLGRAGLKERPTQVVTRKTTVSGDTRKGAASGMYGGGSSYVPSDNPGGRWPANVLIDEEVAAQVDEQSGVSTSAGGRIGNKDGAYANQGSTGWSGDHKAGDPGYQDTGGASRYFYTSKASSKERWCYCRVCKVAFQRTDDEERDTHSDHIADVVMHPTQKPVDLMEWLVRLVTPAGGILLDPFCGTGTTAVAAKKNGFNFVTCDLDENYVKIAQARLASISMTDASRTSAGYFCPGCKAKGEIKLLDKSTVEAAKSAGKKITCTKCMKRFSPEEITNA